MNPDNIGYTISEWYSSSRYKIIYKGVINFKKINEYETELNGKDIKSDDDRRTYITNKRHHEIRNAIVRLIKIAKHYHCLLFGVEKLDFEDEDKSKVFNFLTKKMWCRELTIQNILDHCKYNDLISVQVNPEYSSMVGNILFRHLNMPDMCLSAFEIGRRTYEFYNQYIIKSTVKRKNIIFPDKNDFSDFYNKSKEEFNCSDEVRDVKGMLEHVKNSKSNES